MKKKTEQIFHEIEIFTVNQISHSKRKACRNRGSAYFCGGSVFLNEQHFTGFLIHSLCCPTISIHLAIKDQPHLQPNSLNKSHFLACAPN